MSRQKVFGSALVVISVALVAGSVWFTLRKAEQERIAALPFTQIMDAGEGTYTDIDGAARSLDEYKGKRVLMVAWASWCPQCGEQLGMLARVSQESGTSLPILAVNRKEPHETAQRYLDVVGRHDRLVYLIDTADHAFKISEGFAMPEFVIYESDGSELFHARGTLTESELRALFEAYR